MHDPRPLTELRTPRSRDRLIAGVAAGWAERWQVEPTVVRACLGLLTLVGGLGVVVYATLAALSLPHTAAAPVVAERVVLPRRQLALAAGTAAVLLVARSIGLWPGDGIIVPAAAVALGVGAVWSTGGRSRTRHTPDAWVVRSIQLLAGTGLLAAGVLSLANRTGGLANIGASASAIAVVVGGLAMFAAPAAGRLLRSLDDERALRIREDERAAVAAHLHDSVLQSLVLMQRTDDARRMAGLARRQERELRAWLYGTQLEGEPTSLHAAIDALTVEIETDHDIRVEAVVVGDQPLDDAARSLLAAIREALVNAARHADVDSVDVFVEADGTELTGYVRDTGRGFDRATIPDDRRGISDSIIGRVQRAGGSAVVISEQMIGTEVELRIPRHQR